MIQRLCAYVSVLYLALVLGSNTGILLGAAHPAHAEDAPPDTAPVEPLPGSKPSTRPNVKPAASERVWDGYLWKDEQHRLCIGWPVIAMGVTANSDHIIAVDDVAKYAPLLTKARSYFIFWNYNLEKDSGLTQVPKVLVRVRGNVHTSKSRPNVTGSGPKTMTSPEFISIEFVSDAWLKEWSQVFRTPWSPWRIRDLPAGDKVEGTKQAARTIFESLKNMCNVAGPTTKQIALAKSIAPQTSVDTRFRVSTQRSLLRWLREMDRKHDLKLKGLKDMGPVPPTGVELQRIFVNAASRAEFIVKIREVWTGALDTIKMPYYDSPSPGSVMWTQATLDVVTGWTDKEFGKHQAVTKKTLKQ